MIRNKGFKSPVYASLALALASFGDAYLYAFLPVNALNVGLSVASVGILLSINRFIRIFANQWMVGVFAKYGFRLVTILATALAALSTFGYGAGLGLAGWLLMRIVWGLAYSAMRISSLSYALEHKQQGLSLGISRSVYELGPLGGLVLGPLLVELLGPSQAFFALGVASLSALYFAFKLPEISVEPSSATALLRIPSVFNTLTFLVTFAAEGILIVVLGITLMQGNSGLTPAAAGILAAAFLAYRRLALIFLAPMGGWLADKWGLQQVLALSALFVCGGLALLAFGLTLTGLAITFLFSSVQATLGPGGATDNKLERVQAVSENATWRDIGAAFGALAGGFLLSTSYLSEVFLVMAAGIFAVLVAYLRSFDFQFRHLLIWK